jgi:uncharacterized Tic20 family protein
MSETIAPQMPDSDESMATQEIEPNLNSPIDVQFQPEALTDAPPGSTFVGTSSPPSYNPEGVPGSDERTWAMLAHISILLNLASGVLGVLVALIIYLVYKDRSRYVAYHALQSFVFQAIFWLGAGILVTFAWLANALLLAVLVGFCLLPFTLIFTLVPLAPLVYGVIGAIKTSQGEDFRYWQVGDWVRGTLTG